MLSHDGKPSSITCTPKDGKFLCVASRLPSGRLSVIWDRQSPPLPFLVAKSPLPFPVPEDGSPASLVYTVNASDPNGLGGVELIEVTAVNALPSSFGAGVSVLPSVKVWSAPAAQFQGTPLKAFQADVAVPYSLSDPAQRAFFVRSFDRAGNSSISSPFPGWRVTDAITIEFFTYLSGLAAKVKGASAATIAPGNWSFALSGSLTTADAFGVSILDLGMPAPGTTFTLTATHPTRATKTATLTVGADTTPPAVTLSATPSGLFAPGSTTLTANTSDAVGVTKVEFYRGTVLIGTDTTRALHAIGRLHRRRRRHRVVHREGLRRRRQRRHQRGRQRVGGPARHDAADGQPRRQSGDRGRAGHDDVAGDRDRRRRDRPGRVPSRRNAARHRDHAAVSDDGRADRGRCRQRELHGTRRRHADEQHDQRAGDGDGQRRIGHRHLCQPDRRRRRQHHLRAGEPVPLDRQGRGRGTGEQDGLARQRRLRRDDAAGADPDPCRPHAARAHRRAWRAWASRSCCRAAHRSSAWRSVATTRGDFGSIAASAGTVALDGVKAIGSAAGPIGAPAVLALSGTVHATMTPGNIADYADQLTPAGQGVAIYATLSGSARLTVNGGIFGGAALGGADPLSGAFNRGAFNLTGSSRLDLNNVVLGVDSSGVFMYGAATQLHLSTSVIHANANTGGGYGVYAAKGTPQISLVNSSISGFDHAYNRSSAGIYVGTFAQPGVAATVSATNSVVASNNVGVFVSELGSSPSSLTLNGTNFGVAANTHGGIVCRDACSVDIAGGEISENASNDPAARGAVFHGGIWMGMATKSYQLKLRNMIVVDNQSTVGGNANASDNSGVTMVGNATSALRSRHRHRARQQPDRRQHAAAAQTSGLNVGVARASRCAPSATPSCRTCRAPTPRASTRSARRRADRRAAT